MRSSARSPRTSSASPYEPRTSRDAGLAIRVPGGDVVENHDLVAGLDQHVDGHAAHVARPAGARTLTRASA